MINSNKWIIVNVTLIIITLVIIARYYFFFDYGNYLVQVRRRQIITLPKKELVSKGASYIKINTFFTLKIPN